jgi:hypothetical protein
MNYCGRMINIHYLLACHRWKLLLFCALVGMCIAGCGGADEQAAQNVVRVAAPPKPAIQAQSSIPPGAEPLSEEELAAMGRPSRPKTAQTPPGAVAVPGAEPVLESELPNAGRQAAVKPPASAASVPGAEPVLEGEDPSRAAPAKPEFPADLTQWTAAHFQLARQKHNARLVQAVRELGRGNALNPDAQANALLLGELLKPLPTFASRGATTPGSEADDLPPGSAAASPGLAPAIVETLGVNGSPEARAVLKRVLLGNQPSDAPDSTLTSAALRAIIGHPDAENQKILLAVLTVPDSIRPPGRGQVTADDLQQDCLRQVRPIANADFRLRLAQRANQGVSSPASRARLLALLTTAEGANQNAQIEMLAGGQIDSAMLPALDRQIGQVSQQVLDHLLRATPGEWATNSTAVPPPAAVVGEDMPVARELSFSEIVQLANQLWRPDFSKVLAARVEASDNLQADIALATLAATLPCESVRMAFARRWETRWDEEASAVETSPLFSGGARDPGLLVVLKELPRATPTAKAQPASTAKTTPKANETPQSQRVVKEQAARQSWLLTSEVFVRALVDRLANVAEIQSRGLGTSGAAQKPVGTLDEFDKLLDSPAQAKSPTPATSKPDDTDAWPADLGVTRHAGARIKSAFHLNWPADFGGRLDQASAGPLTIHFVRLVSEGQIEAVANSYSRQLKSAFLRTTDNGRWVDALTKLDGGRARSIDVLITRADTGAPPPRGTTEKLIIDLLCVEVSDPQQRSTADASPSASSVSHRE